MKSTLAIRSCQAPLTNLFRPVVLIPQSGRRIPSLSPHATCHFFSSPSPVIPSLRSEPALSGAPHRLVQGAANGAASAPFRCHSDPAERERNLALHSEPAPSGTPRNDIPGHSFISLLVPNPESPIPLPANGFEPQEWLRTTSTTKPAYLFPMT